MLHVRHLCVAQVMVGAYGAAGAGGGRGALLPAPGKAVIARGPTRNANGAKEPEGPPVTVFIGQFVVACIVDNLSSLSDRLTLLDDSCR